jgi:ribosomal protein S18 acetylase RimI-like enzyme
MRGKLSGAIVTPVGFLEARAGHIVREYRGEAESRFGPVVHSLTKPLVPALLAGLIDGYVAKSGRRTVGLLCQARFAGIARITFCHVLAGYRGQGVEEDLIGASVEQLTRGPQPVARVICEVMGVSHQDLDRVFADLGFVVVDRLMMRASLPEARTRPPVERVLQLRSGETCLIRGWARGDELAAAETIMDANQESTDGQIYPELLLDRHVQLAVDGIVRGSSGPFDVVSSSVATVPATGRTVGVALCSRIAGRHGFLTELAVRRAWQGRGIGSALLGRVTAGMASWRATAVDLAVTKANLPAVRLYEGRGFRPISPFGAYCWPK